MAVASPATHALRPDKTLLTAWLLLLVRDGVAHGYDLRRRFEAQGLAVDPGAMYRLLRAFERDGWVRSRWITSHTGPRRRVYSLTPTGRLILDEVAAQIRDSRASQDAFLRAHDQRSRKRIEVDEDAADLPPPKRRMSSRSGSRREA